MRFRRAIRCTRLAAVLILLAGPTWAEEPAAAGQEPGAEAAAPAEGTDATRPACARPADLMSADEMAEHHAAMQRASSDEEREAVRAAMHERMRARAEEKGRPLCHDVRGDMHRGGGMHGPGGAGVPRRMGGGIPGAGPQSGVRMGPGGAGGPAPAPPEGDAGAGATSP